MATWPICGGSGGYWDSDMDDESEDIHEFWVECSQCGGTDHSEKADTNESESLEDWYRRIDAEENEDHMCD